MDMTQVNNIYKSVPLETPEKVSRQLDFSKADPKCLNMKKPKLGDICKFIFSEQSKLFVGNSRTDTKMQEFLYYKFDTNAIWSIIFVLLSCCSAFVAYEIENDLEHDYILNYVLWIVTAASIGLWITIWMDFLIWTEILYYNKNLKSDVWRKNPENTRGLWQQIAIFFIHPNYFCKDIAITLNCNRLSTNYEISLNSLLSIICLLRLFFIVKAYLVVSSFHTPRVQRLCEINSFNSSMSFALKANFKSNPSILVLLLVLILVFCSFSLRVFEREVDDLTGNNFASYLNTVWCLIITMTTVGYGDMYPNTLEGRIVGIIACVSGIVLISLTITAVTNILQFADNEQTTFELIEKSYMMEEKKVKSAKLISEFICMVKKLGGSFNLHNLNRRKSTKKLNFDAFDNKLKDQLIAIRNGNADFENNETEEAGTKKGKKINEIRDKLLINYSDFKEQQIALDAGKNFEDEDLIIESLEDFENNIDCMMEEFEKIIVTLKIA